MVSRTVSFSDSRVSCSEMPIHSRNWRGLSLHVWPKMRTSPEVGCEQPFEDFDGRGLPCAVRAEQTEAFASLNAAD